MKHTFLLLVLCALCCLESVAQKKNRKTRTEAPKKEQVVLNFAIHTNGATDKVNSIIPICTYLSEKLGIEVKPVTPFTEIDIIEQLKNNEIQLAVMGPFGYVAGTTDENSNIEPFVVYGKDKQPNSYNSCLITYPGSGINSIAEMREKASSLSLMFVNPNSTSGHIFPRLYLTKEGLPQLESSFKEIAFGGSHANTIGAVIQRKAAIGACAYTVLQQEISNNKIKAEDVKTLWVSDDIVIGPIVINKNVSPELKDKLRQALLSMHIDNPEAWKTIQSLSGGVARGATGFIESKDSDYDSVRKTTVKMEDLMFLLTYYND